MKILLIVIVAVLAILILRQKSKTRKSERNEETVKTVRGDKPLPIDGAYQKRWMFTYNEKDAYSKLKPIAEELGYTVFAKVRLLDLLEPTKGNPKYKTYFYKIQSKHVDFVLCDEKLVARYIIELDDRSHDTEPRKKRDEFVDSVLTSVGYKILHVRTITDDIKMQLG